MISNKIYIIDSNTSLVIFRSSNIEAVFVTMVWVITMFMPIFIGNDSFEVLSAKITTINITAMFIYFFVIIGNIFKYFLITTILRKLGSGSIGKILFNKKLRNIFIVAVLSIQMIIFISFFYFNLFESYKIISGSAKDWFLLSCGIICSIILGLFKFIIEGLRDTTDMRLSQKEQKALQSAIEKKRDKTTYFD